MCPSVFAYVISLCVVLSTVAGAPLAVDEAKSAPSSPVSEITNQDADLQGLLNLIKSQSHQDHVMVHQSSVSHSQTSGGETVNVSEKEEKVIDSETGKVLADVHQSVQPGGEVRTEVELPGEGVDTQFVQEANTLPPTTGTGAPPAADMLADVAAEEDDSVAAGEDDSVAAAESDDFSPTDMAEYLYFTQQFDAFFAGLDRLVNSSKMSAQEASRYAEAVATEYNRVLLQDQAFFEPEAFPGSPVVNPPRQQRGFGMDARFPPMGYQAPIGGDFQLTPEEQMYLSQAAPYMPQQGSEVMSDVMPEVLTEEIDPYEFLTALWTEAYGKGNKEAQEIVSMLYNRVSHDGNPDDMGQIKDILLEAAEASFNEENSFSNFANEQQQYQQPPVEPVVPNSPAQLLNTPLVNLPQTSGEQVGEGEKEQGGDEEKQITEEEEKEEDVVKDLENIKDSQSEAQVASSEVTMNESQDHSEEQVPEQQ